MSDWSDAVTEMDAELFSVFGESATVSGHKVTVITESSQDKFGVMAGNFLRLSIPCDLGFKVKKNDEVIYKNRRYVIYDVPEITDGLITFELR